jgi:peroxiredoxin
MRMPEVRSTFQLRVGDRMPVFALPDAWGGMHSSGELLGEKGVLVVFVCNHCPYVVHLADVLGEMAAELLEMGVATVAINPNDLEAYPQDGPEPMKEFAAAHGWAFPYLIDGTQQVALAYGAACTPDFFLFDGGGRLAYAGQFDATRPRSGQPADGGDLREAARRMLSGEVIADAVPASGCSIKWKPGNQPEWWNKG